MSGYSFINFTFRTALENQGICFDMQYLSNSSINRFGLKLSSNDDYLWTNQPNWISEKTHICSYEWTSQNSDHVEAFFSAHLGDTTNKTNASIVALILNDDSISVVDLTKPNDYYLPSWDEEKSHNTMQRLWPLRFPNNVWTNDSNKIEYIGNNQNFLQNSIPRTSYLLSEWITYSRKNHTNIRNKFNFKVINPSPKLVSWQPIVLNDRMQDITTQISIKISNSSLEFELGSYYDMKYIRIGIRIIDNSMKNADKLFIKHLDMDDYCHDNHCEHSANCLVDFSANNSNHYYCQCPDGFIGPYCHDVNYCRKSNNEICQKLHLKCQNYEHRFRCDCEHGVNSKYWNNASLRL